MKDRFRLQVKDHFDAAHYLKGYEGKCNREHGHRWDVEVVIEGSRLDSINMLIDFSFVKKTMKLILDELDHYQLNEQLEEDNPTAEYLARWFYRRFATKLDMEVKLLGVEMHLERVTIWESPECCIKYYEVEDKNE